MPYSWLQHARWSVQRWEGHGAYRWACLLAWARAWMGQQVACKSRCGGMALVEMSLQFANLLASLTYIAGTMGWLQETLSNFECS